MYASGVRGCVILVVVGACGFNPGTLAADGPPPDQPDMFTPTWAVDATSKKGVPANAAEWTQLATATGVPTAVPDHVWLMQDPSGSLQDSIGTVVLTPLAAPTYNNAVAGWSRVAVGTNYTDSNHGFLSTAVGNLNGTSHLLLVYVAVLAPPSTERSVLGIGADLDHRWVAITPAPVYKGTGTGVTPALGTLNPMATVHPLVVKIDATHSAYVIYTDQEKLNVTWANTMGRGGLLIIGNAIVGAVSARYLYTAMWSGPKAELSDADVKKLLVNLGWTVSY